MPEPSSPFDDDYVEPQHPALAKRVSRPWWRWNILTLFGVLFVLVWVRYLLNLSPGATWTSVLLITVAWAVVPMFLIAAPRAAMPDRPPRDQPDHSEEAAVSYRRCLRMNRLLRVFSGFAFVMLAFSVIHLFVLMAMVMTEMTSSGFGPWGLGVGIGWLSLVTVSVQPFIEMAACASLIVLCEIAFRLDHLPRE